MHSPPGDVREPHTGAHQEVAAQWGHAAGVRYHMVLSQSAPEPCPAALEPAPCLPRGPTLWTSSLGRGKSACMAPSVSGPEEMSWALQYPPVLLPTSMGPSPWVCPQDMASYLAAGHRAPTLLTTPIISPKLVAPTAALSLEVLPQSHWRVRGSSSLNTAGNKGHKCAFK